MVNGINIIKRDGSEALFDPQKIINAITKANNAAEPKDKITEANIEKIALFISSQIKELNHAVNVEDIQDMVEKELFNLQAFNLAKSYIVYRYQHQLNRNNDQFFEKCKAIADYDSEEIKQENANKNPHILSTQRDYMAGEVSKELARRYVFSKDLVNLHDKGIIHIHDLDYRGLKSTNCSLVNLDDMLQNGTVISKTKIEKPHCFSTACNVATQIIAQVASGQFGGSTYNMYHLAKFVDVSRQKYMKKTRKYNEQYHLNMSEEQVRDIVEQKTKDDITRGIQTIQYQILTLMTTNGKLKRSGRLA